MASGLRQITEVVCDGRVRAPSANIGLILSYGVTCTALSQNKYVTGNLLAMRNGDLCYLDFGMMSEAPQSARYVRPLRCQSSPQIVTPVV